MFKRCFARKNLGRGDEYVRGVFDFVAPKYDLMNDAMSFGVHRLWKNYYVSKCIKPMAGCKYLDVAGGTGDIAFRIIQELRHQNIPGMKNKSNKNKNEKEEKQQQEVGEKKEGEEGGLFAPTAQVTVFDINEEMLKEGIKRATPELGACSGKDWLDWVQGSAEELPFASESFDSYSVAFGIRNFNDRPKALREAARVLKPGGVLNILEFSPAVTCPPLSLVYSLYSKLVIPNVGALVTGDSAPYQYLVDSIAAFPEPEVFADIISANGFNYVRYQSLTSGLAYIHTGVKC